MLIAFNKPYGVLSQFTLDSSRWRCLAEFGLPSQVYPVGRLDADSEGLLLLSDESSLVERLLNPRSNHPREYWVQIERLPDPSSLRELEEGVVIQGQFSRPCKVKRLPNAPTLPPRDPPIRFRLNVPDCWISMELTEGRNRQVRRMTAAIGHPTLRLVRVRIGQFTFHELRPGQWRELAAVERKQILTK